MSKKSGKSVNQKFNTTLKFDPIAEIKHEIRSIVGKDYLKIIPKTENQELFLQACESEDYNYVIATGIAGCGKSFLSLVQAFNLLLDDTNQYTKIRIFKPLKQLEHEDIGTLPGDVSEKLKYSLLSYGMQLSKLLDINAISLLMAKGFIEIIPMGNIRGLSLDNINIIDEFQNVSVSNSETILTRLQEDGKMIIIGDIRQRDFKDKNDNGLKFLTRHFRDLDPKIKIIEFNDSDCVRSSLIQKITKVYDEHIDEKI